MKLKKIVDKIFLDDEEKKFIESSSFKHSSCFNEWESFLDLDYGGIKSRQKFPMPNFLGFMIYLPKTKKWDVFLDLTLKNITQKGIYDPLDGGFFRYCIDEKWNIPHFEKMLYDNAQLISVLSNFVVRLRKSGISLHTILLIKYNDELKHSK